VVASELSYNDIGYVEDKETFETMHGIAFPTWVTDNPTLDMKDYFISNNHCYLIDSVDVLPDGLSIITDLNNPEGV
jgi:hypothetical protein